MNLNLIWTSLITERERVQLYARRRASSHFSVSTSAQSHSSSVVGWVQQFFWKIKKMSKNGIQRFLIPEGFDIEQIIVSNIRPKKKKKEKINAFRFFFLIRKHQLKDVDEIAEDKNQLLSKIDAEWRGLTEVQRKVIKMWVPMYVPSYFYKKYQA